MKTKSTAKVVGYVLTFGAVLLWGIATREPLTLKGFGICLLFTIGSLIWGHWKKSKADYEEHPHDRYLTLVQLSSFVFYLLTGSIWFFLLGSLGLLLVIQAIRGDSFGFELFRDEQRQVALFLSDCCIEKADSTTPSGVLYGAYLDWSRVHSENELDEQTFNRRLTSLGIDNDLEEGIRHYKGYSLIS